MNTRKRYKIPIAKRGEWPHGDLIQVIDDHALDAIVRNTVLSLGKTGKVLVDFDHFSELPAETRKAIKRLGVKMPTEAAGWISEVYREGDTVYGNMVASREGEQAIDGDSYRLTSPAWRLVDCSYIGDRGGKKLIRPLKVKSVALCNRPNLSTLGQVLENSYVIGNQEDLKGVVLGIQNSIFEKENIMETQSETIATETVNETPAAEAVVANETPATQEAPKAEEVKEEPTVAEVKEAVVQDVNAQVGIIAEAQGLDPEKAQVVADVAVEAVVEGVEAVEQATIEATPVASTIASGEEMDKANARVKELEAKVAELEALLDQEGSKRQEAELQNRVFVELEKHPGLTLENRETAQEALRKDWDLGLKVVSQLASVKRGTVLANRMPSKTPEEMDLGKMTVNQRLKYKMFGK